MPKSSAAKTRTRQKPVVISRTKLKKSFAAFTDRLSQNLVSHPVHLRAAEWTMDIGLFILRRLPLETNERLAAERIVQRSAKITQNIATDRLTSQGISVTDLRKILGDAEKFLELSKQRKDYDVDSKTRIVAHERRRLEGRHEEEHLDISVGAVTMAAELVVVRLENTIGKENYALYSEYFFSVRNKFNSVML